MNKKLIAVIVGIIIAVGVAVTFVSVTREQNAEEQSGESTEIAAEQVPSPGFVNDDAKRAELAGQWAQTGGELTITISQFEDSQSNDAQGDQGEQAQAGDQANDGQASSQADGQANDSQAANQAKVKQVNPQTFSGSGYAFAFNADGSGNYSGTSSDGANTYKPFTFECDGSKIRFYLAEGPFDAEYTLSGDTLNIKSANGATATFQRA